MSVRAESSAAESAVATAVRTYSGVTTRPFCIPVVWASPKPIASGGPPPSRARPARTTVRFVPTSITVTMLLDGMR